MFKTSFTYAAFALSGLVALAACSSGDHGAMTQNKVVAPVANAADDPAPVDAATPDLSRGLIKQAQTMLRVLGFYKGRIDGLWGPESQSATRLYQKSHDLADSGQLDTPTLAALKTASVSDTQAPQPGTSKAAAATPATN